MTSFIQETPLVPSRTNVNNNHNNNINNRNKAMVSTYFFNFKFTSCLYITRAHPAKLMFVCACLSLWSADEDIAAHTHTSTHSLHNSLDYTLHCLPHNLYTLLVSSSIFFFADNAPLHTDTHNLTIAFGTT